MVKKAQKEANSPNTKPRYEYPPNVVTGAILSKYISRGVSLRIPREETHFTEALDSQRKVGKKLYGAGFIISNRIAKILQNAPKEPPTYWKLSDREREIVRKLSSSEEHQAERKSSETPKES